MLLSREKWWSVDNLFIGVTKSFALLVFFLVFAIVASLINSSYPAIDEFGLQFFTSVVWNPVEEQGRTPRLHPRRLSRRQAGGQIRRGTKGKHL